MVSEGRCADSLECYSLDALMRAVNTQLASSGLRAMLFNSLHFTVFFVVVTTVFFALPHRLRGILLLIASVYFYMAFVPVYILILVGTILVDYAVSAFSSIEHRGEHASGG